MSNAITTSALLTALQTAVNAAWPGLTGISLDNPPRRPYKVPYAVIDAWTVAISMSGVGAGVSTPAQTNRFVVYGRWPFPSDPSTIIKLKKIDYANALIAQLQAGPVFAGVGGLPLVEEVALDDPDDPNAKAFELRLTFSCITIASHH